MINLLIVIGFIIFFFTTLFVIVEKVAMEREKDGNNKVKQIYYGSWSDKLALGHETYWADIGDIACLISLALEGLKINVANKSGETDISKFTTIIVSQYKEKFGEVRVYCRLAATSLVQKEYEKFSDEQKKKITLEHFHKQCLIKDCRHYRFTYLMAIRLWPHYRDAILSGADYNEFLFKTKGEFDKACAKEKRNKAHGNYFSENKNLVYKVCGWSNKEK